MPKKNTPYELTLTSKICLYCGEVFTSKHEYMGLYVSAQKQLEVHWISAHANRNTIPSSTQKRADDSPSIQGQTSFGS